MSDDLQAVEQMLSSDEYAAYLGRDDEGRIGTGLLKRAIERLAPLAAVADRLPRCWRYDSESGWVKDVPVVPGMGEKRYIASGEMDARWEGGRVCNAHVCEVEVVRYHDRGNHHMWGVLVHPEAYDLDYWSGPLYAARQDAERAFAETESTGGSTAERP